MQPRRDFITAGQDEAVERFQHFVDPVDRAFQPFGLSRDHSQHHLGRGEIIPWGGQIGAQIEQVVLDSQHVAAVIAKIGIGGESQRRVRLVHRADRFHPSVALGPSRTIDQPGRAVITRAGVDLVKLYQRVLP